MFPNGHAAGSSSPEGCAAEIFAEFGAGAPPLCAQPGWLVAALEEPGAGPLGRRESKADSMWNIRP